MKHKLTQNPTNARSIASWSKTMREFQLDNIFETAVLGRSYEYINSVSIKNSSSHTVHAQILPNKYEVSIELKMSSIYGTCSCPYSLACKHMAATILKLRQISDEEE